MMDIEQQLASIRIGGEAYGGWKTVEVTRAYDAAASSFSLAVIDTWAAMQGRTWPIKLFDECTVWLAGKKVITGYVDRVEPAYDANKRGIQIGGRSKTQDLVDCSAVVKGGQFKKAKLDQIANQVCKPFGIKVKVGADLGAIFRQVQVEPGATAFRTLDDLARSRGVVLQDDPDGNLVITEAQQGDAVAQLVEGDNIFAGHAALSAQERHSEITGKGQIWGDDETNGPDASEVADQVKDDSVPRYRPLLVTPEKPLTPKDLRNRLEFERAVRAGDGLVADITVLGWLDPAGKLWTPGDAVHVKSPALYLDRKLYIKQVTFSQGQGPTSTKLQLVPFSALSKKGGDSKGDGDGNATIWDGPKWNAEAGSASAASGTSVA